MSTLPPTAGSAGEAEEFEEGAPSSASVSALAFSVHVDQCVDLDSSPIAVLILNGDEARHDAHNGHVRQAFGHTPPGAGSAQGSWLNRRTWVSSETTSSARAASSCQSSTAALK